MRLSALENTALTAWHDTYADYDVLDFAAIAGRSGLPRGSVRRVVRAMARKGLTRFVRGCFSYDGEMAGSGYGLTDEGRKLMEDKLNAEAS